MRTVRLPVASALMIVMCVLVLAACGNGDEATATPAVTATPAATVTPAGTATPGATATPEATATPGGTTTPTPGGGMTPTPGGGDAAHGEQLFTSLGCSGCHSTGTARIVGPGLAGIWEHAGDRVQGLDAAAYIEQSLRDPGAYVVEGFPAGLMPSFDSLSQQDVEDLIAYLRTLE